MNVVVKDQEVSIDREKKYNTKYHKGFCTVFYKNCAVCPLLIFVSLLFFIAWTKNMCLVGSHRSQCRYDMF